MPQVLRYPEFGLLQILRYPELYLTLGIRQVVPVVTKVGIAPQVTLQRIDILFALRAGGFDQNEQWLLILLGSDVLKSGSQLFQGLVKFTSELFTRFLLYRFRSRRLELPIQTREVVPFFRKLEAHLQLLFP